MLTDDGLAAHIAPLGAPLHERPMLPEKPSTPVAFRLYVAVWPAETVTDAADPNEKSGAFPLTGTMNAVVLVTSVFRLKLPTVAPGAAGVNVTLI